MTINERVKYLRKDILNLNQKEFGGRIGLRQTAISAIEKTDSITSSNIKLICQEFGINEEWLRTGEGDIYAISAESIVDELKRQYGMTDEQYAALNAFLSLSKEEREFFLTIVEKTARKYNEQLAAQQGTGNAPAAQGQPFGNSEQFQQANADPAISPTKKVSESDTFHAGNISPADAEAHRLLQQELDAQKKAAPPSPSGGLKRA